MDAFLDMIGAGLDFQNIDLVSPGYGSLVFKFSNVTFKRITVKKSIINDAKTNSCRCDLIDYLVRALPMLQYLPIYLYIYLSIYLSRYL